MLIKTRLDMLGSCWWGVAPALLRVAMKTLTIFHRPSWPLSVALELKLFMLHSVLLSADNRDVSLIGSAAPGGLN